MGRLTTYISTIQSTEARINTARALQYPAQPIDVEARFEKIDDATNAFERAYSDVMKASGGALGKSHAFATEMAPAVAEMRREIEKARKEADAWKRIPPDRRRAFDEFLEQADNYASYLTSATDPLRGQYAWIHGMCVSAKANLILHDVKYPRSSLDDESLTVAWREFIRALETFRRAMTDARQVDVARLEKFDPLRSIRRVDHASKALHRAHKALAVDDVGRAKWESTFDDAFVNEQTALFEKKYVQAKINAPPIGGDRLAKGCDRRFHLKRARRLVDKTKSSGVDRMARYDALMRAGYHMTAAHVTTVAAAIAAAMDSD